MLKNYQSFLNRANKLHTIQQNIDYTENKIKILSTFFHNITKFNI